MSLPVPSNTRASDIGVTITDLGDPATRARLSAPAIEIVGNIAHLWGLSTAATCGLLGGISERTWRRWQSQSPVLDQDALTRASLIIGIHRSLRIVFGPSLGDAWPGISNTHPLFAGRTPLDTILSGGIPQLLAVRELVDGWRHQ
jgi:hypothetical protein